MSMMRNSWIGELCFIPPSGKQQLLIEELIKTPITFYEEITEMIGSCEIKMI